MILALLLQTIAPSDRFENCAALAAKSPEAALAEAERWEQAGGGAGARQCLGLAHAAQQRWGEAASAFEAAARQAGSAELWVQAGNARLAAGDFAPARNAFDAAIARGLKGMALGEAHLDRARAAVGVGDLRAARADLDKAIVLVPADPLAWLLSATLARRMGDLPLATQHIAEAAKRSPDDASVALEAGNIAMVSGAPDAAKVAWQGAVANQPQSAAGKAAARALAALEANPPPR